MEDKRMWKGSAYGWAQYTQLCIISGIYRLNFSFFQKNIFKEDWHPQLCTKYYSLGGNCKNHIAGGENGCGKKALGWAHCRKSILKLKLRKGRHTGARDVPTIPLNKLVNKKVFSGSTLLKSTDCSPQYYNQNSEKVRYHSDSFTKFIQ